MALSRTALLRALAVSTTAALSAGIAVQAVAVPTAPGAVAVKVIRWSDGDTVVTSVGKVRLIGVDTPETGTCGAAKAKALALRLAPVGSMIRLTNPGSVKDRDSYGRLLRYANRAGADIALRQIKAGARARYDGRDGYQAHPRQASYRKADKKFKNYSCASGGTSQSYAPVPGTWNCPAKARIKGNRGSNGWIYHVPGQQYYAKTNPEECFVTESAARAAGYRKSKV